MEMEELKRLWFLNKEGPLEQSELIECGGCKTCNGSMEWVLYECPCGAKDHVAMRSFVVTPSGLCKELSCVLNCFPNMRQWLIEPIDTKKVIHEEEEKYIKLLKQADKLIPKIVRKKGRSQETVTFLKETHGIPEDVTEDWLEMNKE